MTRWRECCGPLTSRQLVERIGEFSPAGGAAPSPSGLTGRTTRLPEQRRAVGAEMLLTAGPRSAGEAGAARFTIMPATTAASPHLTIVGFRWLKFRGREERGVGARNRRGAGHGRKRPSANSAQTAPGEEATYVNRRGQAWWGGDWTPKLNASAWPQRHSAVWRSCGSVSALIRRAGRWRQHWRYRVSGMTVLGARCVGEPPEKQRRLFYNTTWMSTSRFQFAPSVFNRRTSAVTRTAGMAATRRRDAWKYGAMNNSLLR